VEECYPLISNPNFGTLSIYKHADKLSRPQQNYYLLTKVVGNPLTSYQLTRKNDEKHEVRESSQRENKNNKSRTIIIFQSNLTLKRQVQFSLMLLFYQFPADHWLGQGLQVSLAPVQHFQVHKLRQ